MNQNVLKAIVYLVGAIATALTIAFGLSSCNVTRVVTTKSEYQQRGDTTIVIQTKVTESYDASKK